MEKPLSAVLKPSLFHTVTDHFSSDLDSVYSSVSEDNDELTFPTVARVDFNSSSCDCDHMETLLWFYARNIGLTNCALYSFSVFSVSGITQL